MELSAKTLRILIQMAQDAPIRGKDAMLVAAALQEANAVLRQGDEKPREEKTDGS